MSMSTGDTRRPNTQKSGNAAATGSPEPSVTDSTPKGGVLPVKKAARPAANGANGARGTGARAKTTRPAAKPAAKPAVTTEPDLDDDLELEVEADSVDAEDHDAEKDAPAPQAKTPTKTAPRTPAKKSAPARTPAGRPARPAAKAGSAFGAAAGGGKGRKPAAPVRVAERRNWGSIGLFILAGVLAVAIIGWSVWPVIKDSIKPTWQESAAGIAGISNYLESNPEWFTYDPNVGNHQRGVLSFPNYPPVGGVHNPTWQNCMGDVYTSQISNEQAVHSLEHGAIWITYNPDLPQDQIDKLASKVRNVEYMMMSPYPDLEPQISLQAWGYQLKVSSADDGRIDEFISALKKNSSQEMGAVCSGGITDATVEPLDLPGS